MKTDKNGQCTLKETGKMVYEKFTHRGKTFFQVDYRHENGELFSGVFPSLEAAERAVKSFRIKKIPTWGPPSAWWKK